MIFFFLKHRFRTIEIRFRLDLLVKDVLNGFIREQEFRELLCCTAELHARRATKREIAITKGHFLRDVARKLA